MCHLSVNSRPARNCNATLSRHRNWFPTKNDHFRFLFFVLCVLEIAMAELEVVELLYPKGWERYLRSCRIATRHRSRMWKSIQSFQRAICNDIQFILIATLNDCSCDVEQFLLLFFNSSVECVAGIAQLVGWHAMHAACSTIWRLDVNFRIRFHSLQVSHVKLREFGWNVPSSQNTGLSLQPFDKTGHFGRGRNHQSSRRFTWDAIQW